MIKGKILIAGGTGLIGKELTKHLVSNGYEVAYLSRNVNQNKAIQTFHWNPELQTIDEKAFENIDIIINLAGENIGEKRWTTNRKKELLDSRINATSLIFDTIKNKNISIKTYIAASATGFYGANSNKVNTEKDEAGGDFIGEITKNWEDEMDKFSTLGIRLLKFRIGIVLTKKGGALAKMTLPIQFLIGLPTAPGTQEISWIDLQDLCRIFIYSIEKEGMSGTYNAVSPFPVSNVFFTKTIGKILHRPIWPIKIPKFILKFILGEMAILVTGNSNVKNERLASETDFKYDYPTIEKSLINNLG